MESGEKQVDLALAALERAQEDLAVLALGADSLEVALREAEVSAARLALDEALEMLEGVVLTASINGVVSLVNVVEGQAVGPNAVAFEVVDPSVVEVDALVDEIDVLFVQVGSQAEVAMDALPGQVLRGTVSSIALTPRTQQGVVSYPISIRIDIPEGFQLVEGLTAVANVVLREDRDVLLVPLQALQGTFDQPVVRVSRDGGIVEEPVVLGNSDDFWVAVLQGLQPGDRVVMQTSEASTTQFGIRPGGGGFFGGGGVTGGGFSGGQRPGR